MNDQLHEAEQVPNSTGLISAIHRHLLSLGFTKNGSGYRVKRVLTKQEIRNFHSAQRLEILDRHRSFIETRGSKLSEFFANPSEVDPESIIPELVEISPNSQESQLFRFASLLWSVPVSQGFGRRLRFLVRDRQNGRLIGLFALGDPVFNLSARDNWIGWNHNDRRRRLVHVMDAYVVGAVPPYSNMIGGKLVAGLITSKEVKQAYERKYLGRKTIIRKKKNNAQLVLLTTTSALGRSSIYNRLLLPRGLKFIRIGRTKGFGHFHLSGEIFESLRAYLEAIGHPYASGYKFGMGPNWKIRVVRAALENIGIDGNSILKHGIKREVYAIPLATNWQEILLGKQSNAHLLEISAAEIGKFCVRRWIVRRASWDNRYREFDRSRIVDSLLNLRPDTSR